MRARNLVSVVLGYALLLSVAVSAQQQTEIASDENGEITVTQPTMAGNLTLQPGLYAVKYHTSHGQHFIRFLKVERKQELSLTRSYTGWYTATEMIKAGEARCRVQPLRSKISATAVKVASENGTARITQVMIKGKSAVCEF